MRKLTVLLILFVFLGVGCEEVYLRNPFSTKPPIVVHLMTPDDYFVIPPGAKVEWDDMTVVDPENKNKTIEIDGDLIFVNKWGSFYSNDAQNRIMEAKTE